MPQTSLSVMIFLPWCPTNPSIGRFVFDQPSWVSTKSKASHRALLFILASNGLHLLPSFHNNGCVALFAHPSSPPRSYWRRSIEIATNGFKHQLSFHGGNTVVRSLFHLWTTLFFFQRLTNWSTSSFILDLLATTFLYELVSSAPWSRTSRGVLIFLSQHPKDSSIGGTFAVFERRVRKLHPCILFTTFILWLFGM